MESRPRGKMATSGLSNYNLPVGLVLVMIFSSNLGSVYAVRQPRAAGTSVFSDLTVDEITAVTEYLDRQEDLNLTPHNHAKVSDAYIFLVEAIRPKKAEALLYLDSSGPAPERAARVILHRGDLVRPVVQEYRVSPLPNPTKHELLINPSWRNPIPFNSRSPIHEPEEKQFIAMIERELSKVDYILRDMTSGWSYLNCTDRCLTWLPGVPPYTEANHHKVTIYLVRQVEGLYLHPIGLQFVLNIESTDDTQWKVEFVWFQGQRFQNFEGMIEAKAAGTFRARPVPEPEGVFTENLRSSLNFRGTPRPEEPIRGPRSYTPEGRRFTVQGRRVKWLGWEFEFGMLASSGIQLFDIKFLEERIVYELSLQEVSVFYSGASPVPSHTTYHDSVTILGVQMSELFPGIDCPSHAEFFSFTHFLNGKPHVFEKSACVFEHDRGIPLRRHTESTHKGGYYYAQGMPDNVLILRYVLTVYNYDYVIDAMFHQAGQIESKVSLTGYLLNSFYTGPEMDKSGHVVNEPMTIASIHHHIVHFKADLDILGQKNHFETLDIELEEIADEINRGSTILNRKVTRSLKKTELEAGYKYNFTTPKYLIMYNERKKNRFGQSRGYRIMSEGMSNVLLPRNYRGFRSRAWAEYQVAVTKYKDNEQSSSCIYSTMEPFDPVMSFASFVEDNDNIENEDLVAWLTLGAHHIPHSEDVPIVTTPGVQLTFFLLPYNYFDEDPSLASRDNIRVTPGPEGHVFKYSGVPPDNGDQPPGGKVSTATLLFQRNTVMLSILASIIIHSMTYDVMVSEE